MEDRIKYLIVKNSNVRILSEQINYKSDLINDFGYDSVTIIALVVAIEKEFGFFFEEENLTLEGLTEYSNLKEYIKLNATK